MLHTRVVGRDHLTLARIRKVVAVQTEVVAVSCRSPLTAPTS